MIKVIEAKYLGGLQASLLFSDGKEGILDGRALLKLDGPLLMPLREESYFRRLFIDAGALCWPNGLELSPAMLHDFCRTAEIV